MAVNKVQTASGDVLIDLTGDTVSANQVLSGKTFHLPSGASSTGTCNYDAYTGDANAAASDILSGKTAYVGGVKRTGTCTYNANTSDANATAGNIYTGKTAYVNGSKITGTMADRGNLNKTLNYSTQSISCSAGYYSAGTITASAAGYYSMLYSPKIYRYGNISVSYSKLKNTGIVITFSSTGVATIFAVAASSAANHIILHPSSYSGLSFARQVGTTSNSSSNGDWGNGTHVIKDTCLLTQVTSNNATCTLTAPNISSTSNTYAVSIIIICTYGLAMASIS